MRIFSVYWPSNGNQAAHAAAEIAGTIANEYAPKGTFKMAALSKRDQRAKSPANIFACAFGGGVLLVILGSVGMGGLPRQQRASPFGSFL